MKLLFRLLTFLAVILLGIGFYIQSPPGRPTPVEAADVPNFIGDPARPAPVEIALRDPPVQHPHRCQCGYRRDRVQTADGCGLVV